MHDYILGIDIGTSSARTILFDKKMKEINKSQIKYQVDTNELDWKTQKPHIILEKTIEAITLCVKKADIESDEISGLSFSSQMYSIFPIDKNGQPLLDSIIWADSRSVKETQNLIKEYGSKYFYSKTGCPVNSIYPLSKIKWIKENRPNIFKKTYKFISIKEYILNELIGEYVVDYSCASATGIFNIFNLNWDQEILDILGLTEKHFSIPVETKKIFMLKEKYIKKLNLSKNISLIIGAGDGPLANLGSGATKVGYMNIDLGTSGAARVITDRPLIDKKERLWCYNLSEKKWAYGGILNNVGNIYKWFAKNIAFYDDIDKDDLVLNLNKIICSDFQEDLYFLPFLLKSRSPYWNDKIKATIYGLNSQHNITDINRALVEGVIFNLLSIIKSIEDEFEIKKFLFTGGIAKSKVWAQLMADILGREIIILNNNEGSAGGAAILGFQSLDKNFEFSYKDKKENKTLYKPNYTASKKYEEKYNRYLKLYELLKNSI